MTDAEWEQRFERWSKPPSKTEQTRCDNAISAVRNAVANHATLNSNTQVFVQGSYRNRVNVRQDSDVDIGVIFKGVYAYTLAEGVSQVPNSDPSAIYTYADFKDDLVTAIQSHFKSGVSRGNKCIKIRQNSYHVDADVVPLIHLREFNGYREIRRGVSLYPDDGSGRIDNYPERLAQDWPNIPLHYENGVAMNTATQRRYKGVVRILKKLRNEMEAANVAAARPIPGYLIECLVFNVSNAVFIGSWLQIVRRALAYIWGGTHSEADSPEWMEVDKIKFLFRPNQPWSKQQTHAFAYAAWDWLGAK